MTVLTIAVLSVIIFGIVGAYLGYNKGFDKGFEAAIECFEEEVKDAYIQSEAE